MVKFVHGRTNRKWFYSVVIITLMTFVFIPLLNCVVFYLFSYEDLSVFSYWLYCYQLMGIGMIVWFAGWIFPMYEGASSAIE